MKFQYTFKQLENSEFVTKAAEEKIGHTTRYLLKDGSGHVYFGKRGHLYTVDVSIRAGGEGHFKASACSESLYAAIDLICDKLEKQFVKKKDKIQNHKRFSFSKAGKLAAMNDNFELDSRSLYRSNKKAA